MPQQTPTEKGKSTLLASKQANEAGKTVYVDDIIANQIKDLSRGMARLRNGQLTDRAIIALLHDTTRLAKADIERILDGIENLEKVCVRKQKT